MAENQFRFICFQFTEHPNDLKSRGFDCFANNILRIFILSSDDLTSPLNNILWRKSLFWA